MNEPCRHHLVEQVRDWRTAEVCIDAERRLVSNIALAGAQSRNGYRYTEPALRAAVPLYEQKPVFLDHAPNLTRPQERSTRDLVGHIVNPRYEGGRIRADVRVLETEAGRTFLALAESLSPAVGMSHVVLAERSADRTRVERIHEVVSVDAVVFPATAATFRESDGRPLVPAGSLEALLVEIDARLPAHVRRVLGDETAQARRVGLFGTCFVAEVVTADGAAQLRQVEWSVPHDRLELGETLPTITAEQLHDLHWSTDTAGNGEELQSLRTERDRLHTEIEHLRRAAADHRGEREAAAVRQEIESLLHAAELPAFAITDELRRRLADQPDTDARRRIIDERRALLRHYAAHAPHSRERSDRDDGSLTNAAFVAAIRRPRASVLG